MISSLMSKLDGKKTYTFIGLWIAYKIAVSHGWLGAMPDLEVSLLGLAGLSLREGMKKK